MCAVSFLLFLLQNGKGKGGSPAMFGERKEIAVKKVENRSLMERSILWAKLRETWQLANTDETKRKMFKHEEENTARNRR